MTKYRFFVAPRFLLFLLALIALSLMAHLIADAWNVSPESAWGQQISQIQEKSLSVIGANVSYILHIGFIFALVPEFFALFSLFSKSRIIDPIELTWYSSTPIRPPIFF
jgi:hypothetical protein